jgi:hypothetical protein
MRRLLLQFMIDWLCDNFQNIYQFGEIAMISDDSMRIHSIAA